MLRLNQFGGFGVARNLTAAITFIGHNTTLVTGGTSHSHTSVNLGSAASGDYVAVIIHTNVGGTPSFSSLVIDGVAGVFNIQAGFTNGLHVAIGIAGPITNSSGTISYNLGTSTNNESVLATWRISGIPGTTAHATASDIDGSNPQTLSLAVTAGGVALAGLTCLSAATTWSGGVTEKYDATTGLGSRRASGASDDQASATTLSISAANSDGANLRTIGASWAAG